MNPQDNSQDPQQDNPTYQPTQEGQQPADMPVTNSQPQVVYMSRPLEPHRQQISPEMLQQHEDSKRKYPKLNLSQGEYVISSVRRHPIGLFSIWSVCGTVIIALFVAAAVMTSAAEGPDYTGPDIPMLYLVIPAVLVSMLTIIFGFISTIIYNANRFYLTNESVIQHIQLSLFSQREQTISLANVEDASFSQDGILSHVFDYGLLRLSTQGDETTYRFTYASNPQKQISLLNNAVENFKNVRPIEHH